MLTGITAVAYAGLYERKTVLVDGVETPIADARVLLYGAPERVSIDAELKAKAWTGAIETNRGLAGASVKMARRDDDSSRRAASSEEYLERVRIAEQERALYDAELTEIKRGGWAPSKFNTGEWYAVDARGAAIKPTRTRKGTRAEMLSLVRGEKLPAPTTTAPTAETRRCALCGHETTDVRRVATLDAQDERTGDWHYECGNVEACDLRRALARETGGAKRLARRALSAVVAAAFARAETPSSAEIAESAERVGPAERDATHWLIETTYVWQLVYNGRGGDDWSLSNRGDWIARRAPRTPELECALRELAAL